MKLVDTLLLAAAIGSLILWIMEYMRVGFVESYWLLLVCLAFLFSFQFIRQKRRQENKEVSPTIRQMAENQKKKKK
ncbi:hypothetical protein GCM10023189_22190 [Nibrella saemangeumensis]|uniref:Uncharacterized protein n=1 Tax=Nibrella saemangeumensis TaxID=1084526 RepID=A0ABP8MRK3_9BACT